MTTLLAHGKTPDEVAAFIKAEEPPPEEPEYASVPEQALRLAEVAWAAAARLVWILCFEVRLSSDPARERTIYDTLLRSNSGGGGSHPTAVSSSQPGAACGGRSSSGRGGHGAAQPPPEAHLQPRSMKAVPRKVRRSLGQAARRRSGARATTAQPAGGGGSGDDSGDGGGDGCGGNGGPDGGRGGAGGSDAAGARPSRAVRRGRWSDVGPCSSPGGNHPETSPQYAGPEAGFDSACGHSSGGRRSSGGGGSGGGDGILPEHEHAHLIDGFPPDCGPDRDHLILSHAKARFERLKRVPHKRYARVGGQWDGALDVPSALSRLLPTEDGEYVSSFPLTENFGQHSVGECGALEDWCGPWLKAPLDGLLRNPWCALLRCRDDADPLLKYPIGIRLYFKMLKAMCVWFETRKVVLFAALTHL